jgi:hypothetical protein
MLTLSILVILIYTAQLNIVHTEEVKEPSYEQFQSLSLHYPQILQCPTDNVTIPYESFIMLTPRFHQLCSSEFIEQNWIDHIGSARSLYISDDFSYVGSLLFLNLALFCHQANETIMNALKTFKSTHFITSQALIENVFNQQIETIIERFQSSIELIYYQSFSLIQFSTQTNTLLTGLFSDIQLTIVPESLMIFIRNRLYENNTCNCNIQSSCISSLTLQDRRLNQTNTSLFFTIPGLFVGCYLVEAMRQSSLECFYQASCITMIEQFLQAPLQLNNTIFPLNSSIKSRFNVSSTINELLSKAMTEEWIKNISHLQYFNQSRILSCTYSYISKFDIIYIITTLISLIGGLTKVLRFIIPKIVKFIRRRFGSRPIITDESSE